MNKLELNNQELLELENFINEMPTKFGMQLIQWLSSKVKPVEESPEKVEE
jgi:hypothetical protein